MAQYIDDPATNDATSVGSETNIGPADIGYPIKSINVIFRSYDQNGVLPPVIINCKLDEKAFDIIEKYRNKSGDSDPEKRFYFDSKRINPNLTLKENGIMNNSVIFVAEIINE